MTDTATLDKTKPTVTTFSASDSNLKVGETATISIVLSEASSTFSLSDITVSGGTLSNFSATSSTQYSVLFTPTANSEANATLDIAADTFTDAAGNNNTAVTQLPITVDTKAPSGHSVSFGDTLYSNTEKGAASFSFSSAEVGATYSYTISSSNGGTNVTGNGTVTSASQQLTNLDLSALNDGTLTLSVILTDTAGNAATAVTANSQLDTAAPSGHSVALNDTSYNSAETGGVNFSFTSAEVGATYSYTLSSNNGGTAVTGNGTVTSAGQTVNLSDISGLNDGDLTLSVTVSDTAGNAATAVTDTATLDKTKPTVTTFSASDSNLKVGETATISIVLSEASSTFSSSDITVSGGTLSNFSTTSSTQYSVLFTPTANSEANATLDIAADTFTDAVGNNNTAATQLPITVDTKAPSGHSVSFGDTLYSNTEKGAASFTFSSAEVGATYSYTISSSNGGTNVTGNGTVTSAGQQLTNLDLSALNDGTLTLSVILTDTAGNAATAVTAASTLDTAAPSGHSVALNDTSYNSAETGSVNFSFTSAEVGATYSYTLSSNNGGTAVTGNGTVTSAGQTVNLSDISGLNDGDLTLSVTVSDTAGNAATAVTDTATLDKTKPTVTTFSASDSNLKVGETATISIVLSEASSTFSSSDITVSGGTLSNFSATSSTQYSVLFTPTVNSEANATLDIAADTFTDAAGNNNTAATQLPITVDTKAPSGHSVSFGDTLYSNTEKGAASFTFSSAEVGATYSYTISSSNGGTNVTGNGTVTSAGQQLTNLDLSTLNDGTLTLSVVLTDTAGNAATSVTATSELDTTSPAVNSLVATDTNLKAGETATISIVLSEASNDFTVDDISVTGGSLSNFSATSNTQYTALFTPTENVESAATLDISAAKFTDSAGNPNTAANQLTLTVDTKAPSGQAVSIDQALINRDNESALSFSLTGLEGTGSFEYSITDANNQSVTGNGNVSTVSTQVTGVNVSNLAEGTLTLSITIVDTAGNRSDAIVDTVAKKYNVAPVLSGQPATSVAQDQTYNFTPTLVDTDDQDTHTYSITNLPSWAAFNQSSGLLSGTPTDADVGQYNGIQISVSDGTDSASLASFNIEVTNVNDTPSGTAFTFTTAEAGLLVVNAAAGLLSTATDPDSDNGDSLTVEQVSAPTYGQLTLNQDGSFSYQHDGSENHTDQFTYRVKDASNAASATYTVTLTITAVADAPTANNDILTVTEDTAGTINLLANDSDPEQDMVASSAVIIGQPTKGSVTIQNGVATYTPNDNAVGADSFSYNVKDAQQNTSNTATVSVTITAENDLPVAKELVINTSEDTDSAALQVRAQTSDVEDGIPTGDLALATQPSKGVVEINQQLGTFVYKPAANQSGTDSFTYTIKDSAGDVSAPMTVSVNIGAVNDKPIAINDAVTTNEDVGVLVAILANDSDVEDQGFNGANITLEDQGNGTGNYAKAKVTIGADGQLSIVPEANQNGVFTFNYTITDSEGLVSDPATVTVTLTPVNDAPIANDNTASLQEEGSFEVNVLGNDTDVDDNDSFNLASVTVVDQPQFGQAVVNAQGVIVYTPNTHYFGDDTFTYTVQDSAGATSNKATVTMTVTPVNDAPVAQNQALELNEDSSLLVTLSATDQESDALSYRIVSMVSNGTLVAQSDTSWLYTPAEHFNGSDTFTFVANDGALDSLSGTVNLTVVAVNDQPTVSGQSVNVDEEASLTITLSGADLDNDSLTYSIVNGPSNGTYTQNGNSVVYTSHVDFFGSDSFTFKVNDGLVDSDTETVNIAVANVNDAPTVSGVPSAQVNEDSSYIFVPTFEDRDGDTLTFSIVNKPSWATFNMHSGELTGVPKNADVGQFENIVISVSDGTSSASLAAFSITVSNTNDVPVISGTPPSSIDEDSLYSFTPAASDIDGDELTFSIVNMPTWAQFDSATGKLSGIPDNTHVGSYNNIEITVSDGQQSASLSAFSITVNNVNDAPTIGGTPASSVDEDSSYSFVPSSTDIDGDSLTFSIQNQPAWALFNASTGALTGTPDDSHVGTYADIVISASDGQFSVQLDTFNIEVVNTNDAPMGSNRSFEISEGGNLTQDASAGLLNPNFVSDDDLDSGDVLSIAEFSQPSFGTLNVNDDGSFSYTHDNSETQGDSFTFRIKDTSGSLSDTYTVSIDITPVSEAPIVVNDSAQTNEDTEVTINLLANDSDPEGDMVASSTVIIDAPSFGSVSVSNGVAIYSPNQDINGDDTFTYIVADQDSNNSEKATASIVILPVNDAPVAQALTANVEEDSVATPINVRAFATDVEDGIPTGQITVNSQPQRGSVEVSSEMGVINYTPRENEQGSDSFSYTIADSAGADSEPATVSITIGEVNDAPVAIDDSVSTVEDTQIIATILSNDSDVEDNGFNGANITLQNAGNFDFASVTILTDGRLQIDPLQDQNGVFTFTYVLTDSEGLSSLPATVTLNVAPVNDAPTANDDIAALEEEGSFAVNVLGNDIDVDGNNEIDSETVFIVSNPDKGQVAIDSLGRIVYTANTNEVGNDSFSYAFRDTSDAVSNTATVTMTIENINDAPIATDDQYSEETFDAQTGTYRLAVLSNDTDVDEGDALTILSAMPSVGSVEIQGQLLVYTPEDTFSGVVIIEYVVKDAAGAISRATAELTINRNASIGVPPTITTPSDVTVNATALYTKVELGNAIATDSNGNVIGVSLVDNNTLFSAGRHLATWRATDNNGLSAFATQNVFVHPLISLAKDVQLSEGQSFSLGVYLNGESPQYPVQVPYTVSGSASSADHTLSGGTIQINSGTEGVISFDVLEDGIAEGNETIVVTLEDTLNRGAKFSTQITIVEDNVAPEITLLAKQDNEQRTIVTANDQLVTVQAFASDANVGDTIALQWTELDPALQNLSTADNEFVFSPQSLATGVYGLEVTASDNGQPSLSATSQIYLEVVPSLVVLTSLDTDGDLIPDDEEGHSDSDNDGIPDFQDAISDCNVMQEQVQEANQFLIEGEPGVCIRKGVTIAQNSTGGVQLLPEELEADESAINIGGLFDFIATGLPQAGDTYSIVIPQRKPIPINAVYRKLKNGQWLDFTIDENNKIYSSLGEPGYCAPPGSDTWQEGLQEGDWCVKLQIVDGGPNDDDGIANGSIIDPGGVAVVKTDNIQPVAQADELTIGAGQSIVIDVLANDSDADRDSLTVTSASVDFGVVTVQDNKLRYTPPITFVGTATIQYSITDGQGGTANSTVTVNLAVNTPPTAKLDEASTNDKASIILDVLANDTDAEGDLISLIEVSAQHGTVEINADSTISYTAKQGFEGVDIITYTIMDSKGGVSQGVARITVTAYKAVNIENKSSGSLGGTLIVMLSALILRRRKALLPSFTLASIACLLPHSAYAESWTVKGTIGEAQAQERISNNSGLQLGTIDDSSSSWSVSGYYELLPNWHVGIGYVDLGQGSVDFSGETLTPDEVHQQLSRVSPVLPEGFTLQLNYDVFSWQSFTGEVFLGAFDWDYRIDSTRDGRFLKSYEASETNAFIGTELGYQLSNSLEVGLQYKHFDISENNVNELSLSLSLKF
ncbi:tandem-95 repeat protein [Pseudoalteromonas luteoviolacea]|uniref:tandem-95 repeat protein n=1 Tax=Pseudoalteromonas luteoviolacea TaxID=43657 RepID=UPI001E29BFAD|nr:Ig-like domain-containing protein [Pseudoalteromonas luteoviolacea]